MTIKNYKQLFSGISLLILVASSDLLVLQVLDWLVGTRVLSLILGILYTLHATEPGYAGDIGAIEVWLIVWLIRCTETFSKYSAFPAFIIS